MEQNGFPTPTWIREGRPMRYGLPEVKMLLPFPDEPDLTAGGATVAKKPRKPRRRKEVTADKFIVLRVTEELYHKVQSASDLAGTDTSKWVRQAVLEHLNK